MRQILKDYNHSLSESATGGTESITGIFVAAITPANENTCYAGSYVKDIHIKLKPQAFTVGGSRHSILFFKNENGNEISSSTPIADYLATGSFPPTKATQDIRRYKQLFYQWTYPFSGIPLPMLKWKIKVPARLGRYDLNDAFKIDIVNDTSSVAATYLCDFSARAYKN